MKKKVTRCREAGKTILVPENANVQNLPFSCEDNQCLEDKH